MSGAADSATILKRWSGVLRDSALEQGYRDQRLPKLRTDARLLVVVLGLCEAWQIYSGPARASSVWGSSRTDALYLSFLFACVLVLVGLSRVHTWSRAAVLVVVTVACFLVTMTVGVFDGRVASPMALSTALCVGAVLYLSTQLTPVITAVLGLSFSVVAIGGVVLSQGAESAVVGSSPPGPEGPQGSDLGMLLVMSLLLVVVNLCGIVSCYRTAAGERLLYAGKEAALQASGTDVLTLLPNRRSWDSCLEVEWSEAAERGDSFSILLVDVDHFKEVNDTLGHAAGDAVLKHVATALTDVLRRTGDIAARLGGDEFAVMLPGSGSTFAVDTAIAAQAAFQARPRRISDARVAEPTLSIGVVTITRPEAGHSAAAVEAADRFLYQAKRLGRNRVVSGMFPD